MFVIFLFHTMWRVGVTSNAEDCKRLMVLKFQFLNKWWFPGYMGCYGL